MCKGCARILFDRILFLYNIVVYWGEGGGGIPTRGVGAWAGPTGPPRQLAINRLEAQVQEVSRVVPVNNVEAFRKSVAEFDNVTAKWLEQARRRGARNRLVRSAWRRDSGER